MGSFQWGKYFAYENYIFAIFGLMVEHYAQKACFVFQRAVMLRMHLCETDRARELPEVATKHTASCGLSYY